MGSAHGIRIVFSVADTLIFEDKYGLLRLSDWTSVSRVFLGRASFLSGAVAEQQAAS